MPDLGLSIGTVKRIGKAFHADVFADKGVEYTPDDIKNLVANFNNDVPIKVEHIDTIFDGKLGKAIHLGANQDFTTMFGVVEWPVEVEKILEDVDKKISIKTNQEKTKVEEISLVINPRIPDANLNTMFKNAFSMNHEEKPMPPTQEEIEKAIKVLGEITPEQKKALNLEFSKTKTEEVPDDVKNQQWYKDLVAEKQKAEAATKTLETQVSEFANRFNAAEENALKERAEQMVNRWESEGKIDPTVTDSKKRVFCMLHRAMLDDRKDKSNGITFSDSSPSRESEIVEEFNKKVPVGWDQEIIGHSFSLPNSSGTDDLVKSVRENTEKWAKEQNAKGN